MPCKKVCDPSTSVCNEKTGRCNKIKKSKRSSKSVKSSSKECKKVCPEGSICNRSTGRCKKVKTSSKNVSSKKECKKVCLDGSICNEATGRCNKVKVAKVNAKKVSSKKTSLDKFGSFKECKKDCPRGSICNNLTGRCRKFSKRFYFSIYSRRSRKGNKGSKGKSKTKVYHPYYGKDIEVDSDDNCGKKRSSIRYHEDIVRDIEEQLCDVLPLSDIKHVLGPVNYSEYKYKDKTISIFGEEHGKYDIGKVCLGKKGTVTVANFLSSLVLNNRDKFYDLFLEFPYEKDTTKKNQVHPANSAVHLIEENFSDCLHSNAKSTCPYKNLRAHYLDVRDRGLSMMMDYMERTKPVHEHIAYTLKVINQNEIIQKELSRSYFKNEISDFIVKNITSYNAFAMVMDVYTLARIFKKFKESKTMPSEPTNIIIYAGDAHAQVYEEFMEIQLGLKPIVKTRTPGQKYQGLSPCINVNSFRGKSSLFD